MAGARTLSHKDSDALIGALGSDRDRLMVLAGQHLGLRISELLSLKVGMVATDGVPKPFITIARRNLKGGRNRKNKRFHGRTIPVHPDLASAIALYLANFPGGEIPEPGRYLFPSRRGSNSPICARQAWALMKTAATTAGLNTDQLSTHSLRKTFAAAMYEASGHDMRAVQALLGHTEIGTTVKYIVPDQSKLDALVRGMASRATPAIVNHTLPPAAAPAATEMAQLELL